MLIQTKLQPPPLRSGLLLRKHLVNRLSAARDSSLILFSGPAGSGKTSLACQWIEQNKFRTAWYSLDEEDNTPDVFFHYLLTALIRTDNRLMVPLGPLLSPPRKLLAEDVTPNIIEALSSLKQDIHLILDDFHQITNDDIHSAMARLIQYMPTRIRIVILSRYSLPAPMDTAIQKKDRKELTAEDLKFTETETADLFEKVMHSSVSADQIRDLNRHVEGWAAGLQLIGLSMRTKGANPDLSYILNETHEQLANFLVDDILRMQPQKIRHFILATALLDRFDPELCAFVTGIPDAVRILARLKRMNLFLIALDTDHKWYRYHHMFAKVIRHQIANLDPDSIPSTLRKAARWYAQNNHLEDALRSAFRSNDFEFAADLMEDYIMQYVEEFDLMTGLRWILKLPEKVLIRRPLLRLQQCGFHFIMMEPLSVKEILTAIEGHGNPDFSRYSGDKLTLCRDYTAYFKCMLRLLYSGKVEVLNQFQILENKFFPSNPRLVAAIEFMMVFILIARGDLNLAETFLAKIDKFPLSDSGQMIKKKIFFGKANTLIARHRGRLVQAETIILQVLQMLNQQAFGHPSISFLLHRHLGHIFYLQNRLDKAQECATVAQKHCEKSGLIDEILAGNELQLQLHLAAGENEKASRRIQQMQALSLKLEMPPIAASAKVCAARLAINQGNLAAAELWSRQRNLQPDEPFSLLFAVESLTQARLYYTRRQYHNTAHLLETLRIRCIKRNLADLVLQLDILLSATHHAMGHHEKAVFRLKKSLAFAETEGYLRPFVDDAGLIAPILRRIADEHAGTLSTAYLEKLFAACDIPLNRPSSPDMFNGCKKEDLSQREIEILGWMARGYQNKEIAQQAFISINTVKSHVRNILVKLCVKTRTQAIIKAREMNLLKNHS